jgi:opacity protein-like surface antigen
VHETLAFTVGGGMMSNPGRYLVLAPTGQATPYQVGSAQGIDYTLPGTNYFSLNPGTTFNAWDWEFGAQYMPNELITYDVEYNHRQADTNYFAGHGGVTSPDGYITTAVPTGWRPDLVKSDSRIIAALLLRF